MGYERERRELHHELQQFKERVGGANPWQEQAIIATVASNQELTPESSLDTSEQAMITTIRHSIESQASLMSALHQFDRDAIPTTPPATSVNSLAAAIPNTSNPAVTSAAAVKFAVQSSAQAGTATTSSLRGNTAVPSTLRSL